MMALAALKAIVAHKSLDVNIAFNRATANVTTLDPAVLEANQRAGIDAPGAQAWTRVEGEKV